MTSTMPSVEGPHQIDLTKLAIPQLTQLKQQIDQELAVFQESLHTLKIAQTKFQDSADSLEKITVGSDEQTVLVPLTGSMYVPGKIKDPHRAIIDIGTGYYAQKNLEDCKEYFKRKVKFVNEQMEKIQLMGIEKTKIRDTVMDIIEVKYQAQLAEQGVLGMQNKA